jgi:diguanylate cyclase (GGDEF)-like protein
MLGIAASIVLCLAAAQAAASDLITSRTVLEDRSGTLTIADVVHRDGTPFGPTLSMRSTNSALWIRLQVRAPEQGSKAVLYILPTYLNEIRLYEAGPGDPAHWPTRVTGNRYAFSLRDRASIPLGFVVDVTAPQATYYLRIKSRSPLVFNVAAVPPEEAVQRDHRRDLLEVFFLTSMLGLLLWAGHAYLLDRQPVVGLFALHQAAYTLFGAVATGYLAPLSSARFPHAIDGVNAALYLVINLTTVLFCRELFKPYAPPRWAMRGFSLLLWAYPVLFAALATGYAPFAVNVNALLIRVAWLYLVMVAFLLRAESTPKRRLLQIFFVFVWLNNIAFWYVDHGSLPFAKADLGMVQILVVDGLLIGGLFALMLHARMRQKLHEGLQSALDLQWVREKFELEHELKKQIEVQAQTDYLTQLSNRGHFLELGERELARAIRFQRPLTLLVIDVDHFKKINDTWGHRTGDTVLQEMASVLREGLRTEDIFGRIGGEEFAVVMVEMEGAASVKVAQRLCVTVTDALIAPNGAERIPVSISIGLTQLQGRSMDFGTLLEEADQALYCAKNAGRNQVFVNGQVTANGLDA